MENFSASNDAYRAAPDETCPNLSIQIVPVGLIAPICRNVTNDFGGFSKCRMIRILAGLVSSTAIPAVRVKAELQGKYHYSLYDGFHRFHASIAAGEAVPDNHLRLSEMIEWPEFVIADKVAIENRRTDNQAYEAKKGDDKNGLPVIHGKINPS